MKRQNPDLRAFNVGRVILEPPAREILAKNGQKILRRFTNHTKYTERVGHVKTSRAIWHVKNIIASCGTGSKKLQRPLLSCDRTEKGDDTWF